MNDLICPTCQVDLMGHECTPCLLAWVNQVLGYETKNWCCPQQIAWNLMPQVWEMDPHAIIFRDSIRVWCDGVGFLSVTGDTFLLRVCRVALWLELVQRKETSL